MAQCHRWRSGEGNIAIAVSPGLGLDVVIEMRGQTGGYIPVLVDFELRPPLLDTAGSSTTVVSMWVEEAGVEVAGVRQSVRIWKEIQAGGGPSLAGVEREI